VVSDPRPGVASDLYHFFRDLGCHALGINIEEQEGVNTRTNAHDGAAVRAFWAELTAAWRADPVIELRDVEWALWYASNALAGTDDDMLPRRIDPIPTSRTTDRSCSCPRSWPASPTSGTATSPRATC